MTANTRTVLKEIALRDTGEDIVIRRLQTHDDYRACVLLQEETWGKQFPDLVPTSILMVSQKLGGLTAGAFDTHGTMVGFIFGMTGYKDGERVHWSDMLAVKQEWRGHGIGTRLKTFQRDEVVTSGVSRVYWTFDPLVARNAHFNLNHLGAEIDDYVPDMYADEGSELHRGLGMDRCVVVWKVSPVLGETTEPVATYTPSGTPGDLPIANVVRDADGHILPVVKQSVPAPAVLIEVPRDIHAVRNRSIETARRWRESTRHAFLWYLQSGYRVSTFMIEETDNRCFYLLVK
jgi:chorismate synthase